MEGCSADSKCGSDANALNDISCPPATHQPGYGSRQAGVMMDGRTTEVGTLLSSRNSLTRPSAQHLVNVYVLGWPLISAGHAAAAISSEAESRRLSSLWGS